jgi:autotransporter passenger strand-loop-strand repeat protein
MTTTFVSSGVTSSGLVVTSGNVLEVLSGGSAAVTSVTSSGTLLVDVGGVASGTIVSSGGSAAVSGTDSGATIAGGGSETVFGSGSANATTVSSGGFLIMEGGSISGVAINAGGTFIDSGGFAGPASFSVHNDGIGLFQGNFTGNNSFSLTLGNSTGTWEISSGTLFVTSGPFAGNLVISAGGRLELTDTDAANGRPIDFADINTVLRVDGATMPTSVISGFIPGERWIDLSGLAFTSSGGAQVSGSTLEVTEGGTTDDLQLDPSQSYAAESFEVLSDDLGGTLIGVGQIATVSSGSGISNATLTSGNFENVFGSAASSTVSAGGTQVVFAGGTASGTTLNGGLEIVFGSDSAAKVNSAGLIWLDSGGIASGATVNASGHLNISSGGIAIGATLRGGTELVSSGGLADGTIVSSGGNVRVNGGGIDSGATISSGGFELIRRNGF